MRCHSRFKGVWQPAELSDLTGQDESGGFQTLTLQLQSLLTDT